MSYSLLLSCFVLIIPLFGKAINYTESLILYGGIILFSFLAFSTPSPRRLTKKFLSFETILILLSLLSTIFAQNIGYSYYGLFNFIFSLTLLNLCLLYFDTQKIIKYILYFSLLYSTIFLLNKYHLLSLIPSSDDFILQFWGHSYLADFLIFSIPCLLYQLFHTTISNRSQKYFYIFSLFYLLLVTEFTHSRSAIIALAFSSLFIVLPKIKKYLRIPLIILIIIFTLFLNYRFLSQNRVQKSPDGSRLEYWQEAARAFLDRPILGHGLSNFFYINKKYQSAPITNTNYAHNSLLEYLCLNGLPFTLIIFTVISLSLIYQFRQNPLYFTIGLTALINSFLDPSWSALGIFAISLFFIFHQNPQIVLTAKSNSHKIQLFTLITFIIISLFFLSKTTSDYLFVTGHIRASLYVDPLNLNPRLSFLFINKYLPSTIFLYSHSTQIYQQLIATTPLPQSEAYFYQLFSLDPKENIGLYTNLANYYFLTQNYSQLDEFLHLTNKNLNQNYFASFETHPVAKIAYNLALIEWKQKNYSSALRHFQIAVNFAHGWSYFQIELANAYWNTNQKDLAKKQVTTECYKSEKSVADCKQYYFTNYQKFLEPGSPDIKKLIEALP